MGAVCARIQGSDYSVKYDKDLGGFHVVRSVQPPQMQLMEGGDGGTTTVTINDQPLEFRTIFWIPDEYKWKVNVRGSVKISNDNYFGIFCPFHDLDLDDLEIR
ncbi:MAG: hypothetical protein JSW58_14515 [Candidatus Latescibacterota bacterium]|nr:MAG: hypothetical protein JSW58_14515 [Candidatus Latescibacterota bacterium]